MHPETKRAPLLTLIRSGTQLLQPHLVCMTKSFWRLMSVLRPWITPDSGWTHFPKREDDFIPKHWRTTGIVFVDAVETAMFTRSYKQLLFCLVLESCIKLNSGPLWKYKTRGILYMKYSIAKSKWADPHKSSPGHTGRPAITVKCST